MKIENLSPVQPYKASKSGQLIAAMRTISQCDPQNKAEADVFIKELAKNKALSEKPVKNFIAKGTSAFVFETPDEKILKLTLKNHLPMNRPHENFDVPVYEHFKCGKIHCYLEEKLYQHGLSDGFVKEMKNSIKKTGYRTFDICEGDVNQIGFSKDGKLYLLDPECAKYKTIFHAVFDKVKRMLKK